MINPIKSFLAKRAIRKIIEKSRDGDFVNVNYERNHPNMSYAQMESIDNWRVAAIDRIKKVYTFNKAFLKPNASIHGEYQWAIAEFAGRLKIKDISSVFI